MKVLWVFAHPEPCSLSAALRDDGLRALRENGHQHLLSDLYAMRWKPVVDADDFEGHAPDERLVVGPASDRAYASGRLSADITAEQQKIAWSDTLVLQFPLWWYGMPAILKGWFDRVFVKGFAFGVTDPETGRPRRYGEGNLAGKRAMVVVTAGARAESLGPRGINGDLNDLLFPLQHGTLWYAGVSVLPPVLVHGADRLSDTEYACSTERLRERLLRMPTDEPLPFRHQNRGDYDRNMVLRSALSPGRAGLGVHYTELP
jgi:NAD(P)H dehydrogenase (quinone)